MHQQNAVECHRFVVGKGVLLHDDSSESIATVTELGKHVFFKENIQRSHEMGSAMVSDASSFTKLATIAFNSKPCSSNSPSEFVNLFPRTSLVILLKYTAPKYFLGTMLFLRSSAIDTFSIH